MNCVSVDTQEKHRWSFLISNIILVQGRENMYSQKEILKTVRYYLISLIISIVIGTVLIVISYFAPISRIRENIQASLDIYLREEENYNWAPGINSTHIGNYTDSLILNQAAFVGTDSIIRDALLNPYVNYEDDNAKVENLVWCLNNDTLDGVRVIPYSRYWHGYLIFIKPLLSFLNVSEIRLLSMCFQMVLLIAVVLELYKSSGNKYIVPFVITIIGINPITTAESLHMGYVYIITLTSLYFLLRNRAYNNDGYWKFFVWIGIAIAYFDFLTYPLISLGINLVFMIVLSKYNTAQQFRKTILASFMWGSGYAGMWIGKWIVTKILIGYDAIGEGIAMVKFRTYGEVLSGEEVIQNNALFVIKKNIMALNDNDIFKLFLVGCIVIIAYKVIIMIKEKSKIKFDYTKILPLMLVSAYPFLWYALVKNHSNIHSFFTYRNLMISILCVSVIVALLFEKNVSSS